MMRAQRVQVERTRHAVVDHVRSGAFACDFRPSWRALLRALLAIQHVGTRDVVLAAAHQREFDLILDVFDMERAAVRTAAHQRAHDALRQLLDQSRARAPTLRPDRRCTARNAFVTAMAIFDGSNDTTVPLRRMTL